MSFHIHIHSGKVAIDVSLIRSVVKFVRFFFILKVFIVPAAGIDYDRDLCLERINSNYWNARRKGGSYFMSCNDADIASDTRNNVLYRPE